MLLTLANSNVWQVSRQTAVVQRIGEKYSFSSRLQVIMTAAPSQEETLEPPLLQPEKSGDVEQGLTKSSPTSKNLVSFELSDLVKETMNYTSLDRGDQCQQYALQTTYSVSGTHY